MSTKSTIASGSGFHLYYDFSNDGVHLELDGLQLEARELSFGAGPRILRVELPFDVLVAIADTRKTWEEALTDTEEDP